MNELMEVGATIAGTGTATFAALVLMEKSERLKSWIRTSLLSEEFNNGEL